jgi:hypothetical protein
MIVDFLFFVAPAAYFVAKKEPILQNLGIYSKGFKTDFINAIQLLGAMLVISIAISLITAFIGFNDLGKVGDVILKLKETSPLLLIYLLIVRVIAEEVFFRGFLLKRIGLIPSTALFGIAHISYGSFTEIIGALILGAVLAKAFERNGNLLPNIFAHMFYNLIFVAFMLV